MIANNDISLGCTPITVRIATDTQSQSLLDTFCVTPQNITMRAHGTLVGFFRVYDTKSNTAINTAYIANQLTSIAKKEYYVTTRRTPEESLEAALTKVNHALADFCANNDTDWLAGLDGVIAVFTETGVNFSVCGRGRISLYRHKRLTHISDGLTEEIINPLAVFSDIAGGDIIDGDTFLIATRELDDVVNDTQLQTACTRYTGAELEQFLHTALVNHTTLATTHIVTIAPVKSGVIKRAAAIDVGTPVIPLPDNAFGANAYSAPRTSNTESASTEAQTEQAGQIYIHGDDADTHQTPISEIIAEHTSLLRKSIARNSSTIISTLNTGVSTASASISKLWQRTRPVITDYTARASHAVVNSSKRAGASTAKIGSNISNTISATARNASTNASTAIRNLRKWRSQKAVDSKQTDTPQIEAATFAQNTIPSKQTPPPIKSSSTTRQSPNTKLSAAGFMSRIGGIVPPVVTPKPEVKTIPVPKTHDARVDAFFAPHAPAPIAQTLDSRLRGNDISTNYAQNIKTTISTNAQTITKILRKTPSHLWQIITTSIQFIASILPSPTRLVAAAGRLTPRARLMAVGVLIAIIIIPITISRIMPRTPDTIPTQIESATVETPQLPVDASATPISRAHTLHVDSTIVAMLSLRNTIFTISPREITQIINAQDKKTFTLPAKYGDITHATVMSDLNMILLLTDKNEVISFNTRARIKFVSNNITLPAGIKIDTISAYTTYLYIVDNSANAIYRYPRAAGGFGAARSWLKSDDRINAQNITIDGNIYTAQADGNVAAFFRNVRTDWQMPSITPPLMASAVWTASDTAPLYVIDRTNARIISIDKKSSELVRNFTNEDFRTATTLTVDERTRIITVLFTDGTIATYRFQ